MTVVVLFILTIVTAVSFHNFLHLPPAIGMMFGLAYLKFFAFYLKKTKAKKADEQPALEEAFDQGMGYENKPKQEAESFDVFKKVAGAEWDTLFFFYGVILAVGGLGFMGYLAMASESMYGQLGPTTANVIVGLLSAIVDNIPVMFAVLTMQPDMSHGQWLLVTLTAGVGGSLLSVGSAAGVALMGQARGIYTFASHLKWTPVIALGYIASIYTHLWINASHM
jgi:Na+/H+ antiporter NhaD/arsenite permease-like protein